MLLTKGNRTISAVLERLIAQDYRGLLQLAPRSRLTPEEIKSAVSNYPYRLIFPTAPLENLMDVVKVAEINPKCWSVNLSLWTKEEGRSDLTLEMHLIESADDLYTIEIDDLHVL